MGGIRAGDDGDLIASDGVRLSVRQWGEARGTPVLADRLALPARAKSAHVRAIPLDLAFATSIVEFVGSDPAR